MQITNLQAFIFAQSLVTKIKFPDMELTRVAPAFRNAYKKARGLKRNATALETLKDLKKFCDENNWQGEIERATKNYPEIVALLAA